MLGLFLGNLKNFCTGTAIGSKRCIDVNISNVTAIPVTTSGGLVVKETRFHDCSATTINAAGGTWVQIGGAAALANTIIKLKVSSTFGEPVGIRKAADAAAAAALSDDTALLNQGQSTDFEVSLSSGDKLWVLSKSISSVTSGYLTLNLVG